MPLSSQASRLGSDSARKFLVQAAVVSNHAPVRCDLLAAVAQVFFGGFGGDANKYCCRQRTSSLYAVVPSESRADLRHRYKLASLSLSDQCIDVQRLRDHHSSFAQSLCHNGRNVDDL